MVFLNNYIMNRPEIMVSFTENKFDQAGRLTDEVMRQKVKEFIVAMLQWIIKFYERNRQEKYFEILYYCFCFSLNNATCRMSNTAGI